ncbi:MAG: PQQ-dependent sugar dehydrogenase [Myxococcota bacterium]
MRVAARVALGAVCLGVASFAACQWVLPERFAVNAPMLNTLFGIGGGVPPAAVVDERFRAPAGFQVSLYAAVPRARLLHFTPAGDLLVSAPRTNQVWLLERDRDGDGRPDAVRALDLELDRPHGLAVFEGALYVAEGTRIRHVDFDVDRGVATGAMTTLVDGLPDGGNHWTRTLGIGPDRGLYVTVGSSCNVCEEEDERRAAMLRYELDGSGYELYATGLRNAVDFGWHPATGALYATDNGRDLLGDDFPPCELDRIVRGGFYGWPYVNGDGVADPDFGGARPDLAARAIPPAHAFRAHNAPLGIGFAHGASTPPGYAGAAFVALHGSWNRTRKDGYRVVSLHWRDDGTIEERPFLDGFEAGGEVIGRPVDAEPGPDGAVYVSDDYAGAVWRVAPDDRAARAAPAGDAPRALDASAAGTATRALAALGTAERAELSARGAALYERHACASCHEAERAAPGVVSVPLHDLSTRYDIDALAASFESPTPPMPVFDLDASERRALAVYLLSRETAEPGRPGDAR